MDIEIRTEDALDSRSSTAATMGRELLFWSGAELASGRGAVCWVLGAFFVLVVSYSSVYSIIFLLL